MAKRFIRISLASKFRLLMGTALLAVIAAALVIPWYFMELLAQQNLQVSAEELTRMRLDEFIANHSDPKRRDEPSSIAKHYASGEDPFNQRKMLLRHLVGKGDNLEPLDTAARRARKAFEKNRQLSVSIIKSNDDEGRTFFRCFRAVRMDPSCTKCHNETLDSEFRFATGQLVAMVDVSIPGPLAAGQLVFWTRVAFLTGGTLAAILASVLFVLLARWLVLRPIRQLGEVADKVADGDLSARSSIQTGDELQHLGESFNEMLEAIVKQTQELRSANKALDLKLNELAEANVTLYRANQVKSEFLANTSHELRTPLNSIIGFADLITEQGDERIRRWGSNVSIAARNLMSMINDLLDLAKIEAGRDEVRLDRVAVGETCRTLLALMKPLADKKAITLEDKIDPDLPLITTDGGKLQQILYNLLSNAVKFTPPGGAVTLSAKIVHSANDDGDGNDLLEIVVSDTGPGIAETEHKRIFDKFYQVDQTLTKSSGGTGLGLAIAKELTNLLGGRLELTSHPGNGAIFSFHLKI